jgi:hypothetical protein
MSIADAFLVLGGRAADLLAGAIGLSWACWPVACSPGCSDGRRATTTQGA